MNTDLDQLCINTLRTLAMDAVQRADSGYPGMPVGAADVAYVLWTRFLKHNPGDPDWPDRDRFILQGSDGEVRLHVSGGRGARDRVTGLSIWWASRPSLGSTLRAYPRFA